MTFVPRQKRPKPRRIYISDELWRELKASCALCGISISEWFRQEAKRKTLIKAIVVGVVIGIVGGLLWCGCASEPLIVQGPMAE